MANQQILNYIRQNLEAGYTQQDIIAALQSAGWSVDDIKAGFLALKGVEQAKKEQRLTTDQKAANAEIIRIEAQVKQSNERDVSRQAAEQEGGIYGFLIRNNFASSKQSANVLFVAGIFFAIALLYWIFLR